MRPTLSLIVLLILCPSRCVSSPTSCGIDPSYAHHTPDDFISQAPDQFMVEMTVILGRNYGTKTIKIEVTRAWSPLGADRFYALVVERYFDCAIFYRNVPEFIVQFGYAADPDESAAWRSLMKDDPVLHSNSKGTLTFASSGDDSRSTHLFFNLKDNSFLDSQGFSPFAIVVEGYDDLNSLYNPTPDDSGGISQGDYESGGNEWVLTNYPDVSMIQSITLTDDIPGADNSNDNGSGSSSGRSVVVTTWTLVSVAALVSGVGMLYVGLVKCRRRQYHSMDGSETLSFQSEDNSVTIEL